MSLIYIDWNGNSETGKGRKLFRNEIIDLCLIYIINIIIMQGL